jgi:hypothetical protein
MEREFIVTFINQEGIPVRERPVLLFSGDGQQKSLFFFNNSTVLASVPADARDADLWRAARQTVWNLGLGTIEAM